MSAEAEAKLFLVEEASPLGDQEPASSTPVTEEPASSTPVTEEPASSTPVTEEPASSTPVTEEPASSTPVTEEPAPSTPVTEKPVSSTPVTEEPASSTPVTEKPASSTPVTEEPASSTPVTEKPVSSPVNEECGQKMHPDEQDKQGSIPVEPVAFGKKLPETVAERITKAQELKQEGNGFFKTGKWKKAIGKYHRALLFVKGITDRFEAVPGVSLQDVAKVKATAEEEAAATSLLVAVSNNLAACLMKMEEWEKALVHTTKVLKLEPKNIKALFRSGVVKLNLNRLEEAEEDLKKAEELDPDDAGIKRQLQLLRHKRKQYQKSEQQMYSAMFKR